MLKSLALAAAACLTTALPASALTYGYRVYHNEIVLDASGDFELNEAQIFNAWLMTNAPSFGGKKISTVVFNSLGGNVSGGETVAAWVVSQHLKTGIALGGSCASACVLAWSAGVSKSAPAGAPIGVHQCGGPISHQEEETCSREIASFLAEHGAPKAVVTGLMETPSSSVYWLTAADLAAWKVTVIR